MLISLSLDPSIGTAVKDHPFVSRHLLPSLSDPLCEEDSSFFSRNATPHSPVDVLAHGLFPDGQLLLELNGALKEMPIVCTKPVVPAEGSLALVETVKH